MQWYYVQNGQQRGPVNEQELNALFGSGTLANSTLVWREGMPNWQPWEEVRIAEPASAGAKAAQQPGGTVSAGTSAGFASAAGTVCSECGKTFPPDELIRLGGASVCANCKPLALQKLKEGVARPSGPRYAGFWIRVGAKLIDLIILSAVNSAFMMVVFMIMGASGIMQPQPGRQPDATQITAMLSMIGVVYLLMFGAQAFYQIWFVGRFGATPGKMACGLVVVTGEGGSVSYARATGRFFGEMVSGMIMGIGYLLMLFDDQKRTLHDHMCDTRVLMK